jgi:hypothetical protein
MDMIRDRGTSAEIYMAPNVEGMVRRSDGKNTIWINGRALSANERQATQADKLSIDSGQRITIRSHSDNSMSQARPITAPKPGR